jgi:hypothetical protein
MCRVVLTCVSGVHITLLAEREGGHHLPGSGVPLHGVRAARMLCPKPRFSYLDLCSLDARTVMLPLISFRYFVLYLYTFVLLL